MWMQYHGSTLYLCNSLQTSKSKHPKHPKNSPQLLLKLMHGALLIPLSLLNKRNNPNNRKTNNQRSPSRTSLLIKTYLPQITQYAPPITQSPSLYHYDYRNRYKTELCKSFTETGYCRYGAKCQFAHGKEEVRPILRHPKYKTEVSLSNTNCCIHMHKNYIDCPRLNVQICKTFHTTGTCPYGIRCRFIHTKSKEESILAIPQMALESEDEEDAGDDDVDRKVSPPPGIPGMLMSPYVLSLIVHARRCKISFLHYSSTPMVQILDCTRSYGYEVFAFSYITSLLLFSDHCNYILAHPIRSFFNSNWLPYHFLLHSFHFQAISIEFNIFHQIARTST